MEGIRKSVCLNWRLVRRTKAQKEDESHPRTWETMSSGVMLRFGCRRLVGMPCLIHHDRPSYSHPSLNHDLLFTSCLVDSFYWLDWKKYSSLSCWTEETQIKGRWKKVFSKGRFWMKKKGYIYTVYTSKFKIQLPDAVDDPGYTGLNGQTEPIGYLHPRWITLTSV